jgi:hypothetical protein
MGSLVTDTPYSEITATLEILDHLGVGRDDLRKFRAAVPEAQKHVVYMFRNADSLESISTRLKDQNQTTILSLANDCVSWPAMERFVPKDFFQTREGLWISTELRSRILARTNPCEVGASSGKSFDLRKDALDHEIVREIPEGYEFVNETEVCARIAAMIQRQPNGQKGELLSNGYANLFYVRSAGCVVHVYWRADRRDWRVYAWPLDGHSRFADDRIFSRN